MVYESSSDPTTGDDVDDGYKIGDEWHNTTDDGWFKCVDASAGSAVWKELQFV
jgi:hypothetical protein